MTAIRSLAAVGVVVVSFFTVYAIAKGPAATQPAACVGPHCAFCPASAQQPATPQPPAACMNKVCPAGTQPAMCPLKGQAGWKARCAAWKQSHCQVSRVRDAMVVLVPTEGSDVQGTITFKQLDNGHVRVTADVTGLAPGSEHAWHIHQFGNLSDPHGKATGGHYNPQGNPHGLPGNDNRHAGDFGNLTADNTGRAVKTLEVDNITLAGPMNPILGRGFIIHATFDNGGQPTGHAGARIAQGVIGVAQPAAE